MQPLESSAHGIGTQCAIPHGDFFSGLFIEAAACADSLKAAGSSADGIAGVSHSFHTVASTFPALVSECASAKVGAGKSGPIRYIGKDHGAFCEAALRSLVRLWGKTPSSASAAYSTRHQAMYWLLALEKGQVSAVTGDLTAEDEHETGLVLPVGSMVHMSDETCDMLVASATAFVANTTGKDPLTIMPEVAAAIHDKAHRVALHEAAVVDGASDGSAAGGEPG